jgi:hypothetical protein
MSIALLWPMIRCSLALQIGLALARQIMPEPARRLKNAGPFAPAPTHGTLVSANSISEQG